MGVFILNTVTLLVVEDEAVILVDLESALEDAGFAVISAYNGAQALTLLESEGEKIVGLVTDIRVGPGPNGWEIAHKARELNPDIPIVYMSGDSARDWPVEGVPNSLMIPKPFATAQVVTAISTLLNKGAG